ncbi:NRAMP family divalent metal transporter [Saccharomonospora azurea]|jgi:Mn2+/Fe2+ NRAMP family transporter|uniref:NRAMP family divalent metal transporter n=1 Tax=Saccharomonospora azurea TaxID=40988 RepID=UPI000240080E|nr:NRAMP family divalent metal transporter [Saccharomonospora azurea]EHK87490.1 Mn2+/Fe2_ transporter, NRAMP family protein [Saccharomonospora azurea SZMC 14600]
MSDVENRDGAAPATSSRGTFASRLLPLFGAIALMATSAIGPGFLTQTATFTQQLGAAFSFGILISVLLDLAIQLNVWRVIGVSGLRAQELAQRVLPGLGVVLSIIVFVCGFIANMGNVAGAGLGLNVLFGLDPRWGAVITTALALVIFLNRYFIKIMDRTTVPLGLVMLGLTLIVAVVSTPPVDQAALQTVVPDQIDILAITTIVGGTVGGYITYAGAHKLLASGISGPGKVRQIANTSAMGVLATGVMRWLLFLAVLGVVSTGAVLDVTDNPAADAFQAAAGDIGFKIFGVVLWAAAMTSVIGASFTSISFISTYSRRLRDREGLAVSAFVVACCTVFLLAGQTPVTVLVFSGGFNGLVLPLGFTVTMWIAWRRRDLLRGYRYPRWLIVVGVAGLVVSYVLAVLAFEPVFALLQ